jgi:uncharacterized protein YceK
MTTGPRGLAALAVAAGLGGCGATASSSATSPDPASAARAFVAAVTRHDRNAWCAQIGVPFGAPVTHSLTATALAQCRQDNLFNILGDCDIEGAIHGSSVSAVSNSGQTARVRLSSGARLTLERAHGRWLVSDMRPGPHIVANGCAGDVPSGAPTV